MEAIDYHSATARLYERLSATDFAQLPISDYNKNYISNLMPAAQYYMEIYTLCFREGLSRCDKPAEELTLVDYGGGSGFLSMLAKEIGIGNVIYVDLNIESVKTITLLKELTGTGPDVILHGDHIRLQEWCRAEGVLPELLISTDVIEHIYDLKDFFKGIAAINNRIEMIFTTASTPYNPFVKRRLRRMMRGCETGTLERPNYYTKRVNHIRKNFPALGRSGAKKWAVRTRGLTYEDISEAITNNERPLILDAYNTCDPETGNWTERILPIREYRETVAPYDYKVYTKKGFYNTKRPKLWKTIAAKAINQAIKHAGKAGFILSPFILLSFSRK